MSQANRKQWTIHLHTIQTYILDFYTIQSDYEKRHFFDVKVQSKKKKICIKKEA